MTQKADELEDAIAHIREKAVGPFGLRLVHRAKPQRFRLREHGLKRGDVQITS